MISGRNRAYWGVIMRTNESYCATNRAKKVA